MENMKKIIKIIFHNENIDIHKTPNPIREIRVPKLFFISLKICLLLSETTPFA